MSKKNKNIFYILICCSLFISLLSYFQSQYLNISYVYSFMCVLVAMIVICKSVNSVKSFNFLILIFMSLILKFGMMIFQAINKTLPLAGLDWQNFDYFASEILLNARGIKDIFGNTERDVFTKLITTLYYIMGENNHLVYPVILVTNIIAIYFLIKILKLLEIDTNILIFIVFIYMMWPLNLIYSITYLREMPIQMLVMISIYYCLSYIKNKNVLHVAFAVFFSLMASLMHAGLLLIPIIYMTFYFFNRKEKEFKLSIKVFALILILVFIISLTPIWPLLLLKLGQLDNLTQITGTMVTTTYISSPNNIGSLFLQLPLRIIYYFFSPLPWHINNLSTVLAYLMEGLPRLLLYVYLFRNYKNVCYRCKEVKNYVYMNFLRIGCYIVFATNTIFSIVVSNYGTAMRHRLKLFPFELVILAIVMKVSQREDKL